MAFFVINNFNAFALGQWSMRVSIAKDVSAAKQYAKNVFFDNK